jgi:hypothetical protein
MDFSGTVKAMDVPNSPDGPSDPPAGPSDDKGFVTIAKLMSAAEAHALRMRLEAAGVDAEVIGDISSAANMPWSGGAGESSQVMVRAEDIEKARQTLDQPPERPESGEEFTKTGQLVRPCPECESIKTHRHPMPNWVVILIVIVSVLTAGLMLGPLVLAWIFYKTTWECEECGHNWGER